MPFSLVRAFGCLSDSPIAVRVEPFAKLWLPLCPRKYRTRRFFSDAGSFPEGRTRPSFFWTTWCFLSGLLEDPHSRFPFPGANPSGLLSPFHKSMDPFSKSRGRRAFSLSRIPSFLDGLPWPLFFLPPVAADLSPRKGYLPDPCFSPQQMAKLSLSPSTCGRTRPRPFFLAFQSRRNRS